MKLSTEPAKALVEAAPSSRAMEAFTDFSDRLVAAEAVSLHKLKRCVDVTSAWTSNLYVCNIRLLKIYHGRDILVI